MSQKTTAAVAEHAKAGFAYAQRSLDRVVAPSTRQEAISRSSAYANSHPLLFVRSILRPLRQGITDKLPQSLATTQLAFALLPLVAFASFVLATLALTVAGGIAFTLFWAGVALLFLVPALLTASVLAVLVWAWGIGCVLAFRAVYSRVPDGVKDDVQTRLGQAWERSVDGLQQSGVISSVSIGADTQKKKDEEVVVKQEVAAAKQ